MENGNKMTLVARFRKRLHEFGALGAAEFVIHKLCGFPKTLVAFPPRLIHQVSLRFDTTDILVFDDVIIKQDYSFGLPTSARTVVDAGANVGLTSIFYATRFPNAKVFAIEAEHSNFEVLRRNVRAYPNITPIEAALWSSEGNISINSGSEDPFSHWGFEVSGHPGDVRAITIPGLMSDYGIDYIDLLKVNIEGSEKEVFENCDWQGVVGSVVIELHDRFKPGCSEAVNNALASFSRSESGYLTCYQGGGNAGNDRRR
jgi:FkbM family methyltransferase